MPDEIDSEILTMCVCQNGLLKSII